jgi:ABC-type multidrug transport system permease subunit
MDVNTLKLVALIIIIIIIIIIIYRLNSTTYLIDITVSNTHTIS